MSEVLYFAYGSNLASARLRGRVPSAVARGVARAPGFALHLDKRGADGTGKANLRPAPDAETWGVVYALDPASWPDLDACERGYARVAIDVWQDDASLRVQTYRSEQLTSAPPLEVYLRWIRDGAREHRLPEAWCAMLDALSGAR